MRWVSVEPLCYLCYVLETNLDFILKGQSVSVLGIDRKVPKHNLENQSSGHCSDLGDKCLGRVEKKRVGVHLEGIADRICQWIEYGK